MQGGVSQAMKDETWIERYKPKPEMYPSSCAPGRLTRCFSWSVGSYRDPATLAAGLTGD